MTEYEQFQLDYPGWTPEEWLLYLKDQRAAFQRKIDNLIEELNSLTEKKNSSHYEINKLKRLIRENDKEIT